MIDPYTPDTIEGVRNVLRGLSQRMKVEIGPGIPLAAKTVADLRARTSWPPGLRLIVPDEPDRSESVVKVEHREWLTLAVSRHRGPSIPNGAELLRVLSIPTHRLGSLVHLAKFAVAGWHLHERLWHDRKKPDRKKFVAGLIKACPELRLMRDLADAAKHHKLDRKSVTLKSIVGAEGGGRLESFSPLGMTTSDDRGSLEIVQRDGSRHDPYEVFRSVIQFWQSEVKK